MSSRVTRRQKKLIESGFSTKKRRRKDTDDCPLKKRVKTWDAVHRPALTSFSELFEKGLENGGELFEDSQFYAQICALAACDEEGLKLKPKYFRSGSKIRHKIALQYIFELMLKAERADELEYQYRLLEFLEHNQGSKRDFVIAECLESFIDFSEFVNDAKILELVYKICRSFGEQELKIIAEALQLKQLNEAGFLLFFAVMYSVCSKHPPDDIWERKYLDPENKDTFPKRSQFFAEAVTLMSKKTTLKSKKANRDVLRVLLILMSRFLPLNCRSTFMDDVQSRYFGNLGWAETHSATPLPWKE